MQLGWERKAKMRLGVRKERKEYKNSYGLSGGSQMSKSASVGGEGKEGMKENTSHVKNQRFYVAETVSLHWKFRVVEGTICFGGPDQRFCFVTLCEYITIPESEIIRSFNPEVM